MCSRSFLCLVLSWWCVTFGACGAASATQGAAPTVTIDRGDAVLAAEILVPETPAAGPVPGAVMVHGSGRATRELYRPMAQRLANLGFAVMLYDKRGVGQSTGRYEDLVPTNSERLVATLAADAEAARVRLAADPRVDAARTGYFGGSQAGWIMPLAADGNAQVRFLIVLSGPAVSVGLEIAHGRLTQEGKRDIPMAEVSRTLAGFSGVHGFDPKSVLGRLKAPTLWLMGERDVFLPLPEVLTVVRDLPAHKSGLLSLVVVPGADHQFNLPDGSRADTWSIVRDWCVTQKLLPPQIGPRP